MREVGVLRIGGSLFSLFDWNHAKKQGRIHDNLSHVRVARGSEVGDTGQELWQEQQREIILIRQIIVLLVRD